MQVCSHFVCCTGKFYGLQVHGARLAERIVLIRRPDNPYDNNYLNMRVAYRSAGSSIGGGSCAPLSFAV